MANVLKMDKQTLIKQHLILGWSYRRIHHETGIHLDTIAKYDHQHSKWAKVPLDKARYESTNSLRVQKTY